MGVINIVKLYPDIFGKADKETDEDDAWRIIASIQGNGSNSTKFAVSLHYMFTAVSNLFKVGLREEAVEMTLIVLKRAIKQQHYSIAQQLCKLLVDDSFLYDDMASVHKYNLLYRKYSEIVELEYQAQLMYGELVFNHNKGIESNEIEIIRGLSQIEEKLQYDSLTYHYYYHSCQIILASESDYEEKLKMAIGYFENLYYNHNSYLSSFVVKLALHYQKGSKYKEADVLISSHLRRCKKGSTTWFKYMKTTCLLYFVVGDLIKAKNCFKMVFECEKYRNLSKADKAEWIQFQNAI